MVVNGKGYVVAFNPTGGDSAPGTSTLSVPLLKAGNVVRFEGYNGGWGEFFRVGLGKMVLIGGIAPNIDRLMVPVS